MDAPHKDRGDDPRLWRWRPILAVWSVPVLLTGAEQLLRGDAEGIRWEPLLASAAFWCGWALATPAIITVTDRWPLTRPLRAASLARHVGLVAVVIVGLSALLAAIMPWSGEAVAGEPFATRMVRILRGPPAVTMVVVYALVVAAAAGLGLRRRARRARQRAVELAAERDQLARRLAETRLEALQRQLRPHFLFNTLNTIAALMTEAPDAARRMTARLAALLRASLEAPLAVTLDAEVELLESYLDVERIRFGQRIAVDYRIDDAVRGAEVPSFLLQPLVENAFRHGLAAHGAGSIRIAAENRNGRLEITVADDGTGLTAGPPSRPAGDADGEGNGAGIGIENVRARLEERYGTAGRLTLRPRDGGGAEAVIVLPLTRSAP